MNVCRIPGRL